MLQKTLSDSKRLRMEEEDILNHKHEKLSIIIPVYNEEKTLEESYARVRKVNFPINTEIIIIDDCSTDQSPQIIDSITKKDKDVMTYENPKNMGKGASVAKGFELATGTIISVHDADLEYDPNDIKQMLDILLEKNYDVMYGNRPYNFRLEKSYKRNIIGNIILSMLSSIVFLKLLYDVETCYKIFRKEIIKDFSFECRRFDFEIELTAKILRSGYDIHFKKISYFPRKYSEGKKINWKDGLIGLQRIVKYRFVRFHDREELLEPLFRILRVRKVKRYLSTQKVLLDLGCGQDFKFLRRVRRYIKLGVGVDKFSRKSRYGNLLIMNQTLDKNLFFEDSSFDVITLLAVLEHVNHPQDILNECSRVMKKGGKILLTVPSRQSKPILEFLSYKIGIVSEREISDHKNYFTREMLSHMLKEAGFKDIRIHPYNLGMNYFIAGDK